MGRHEGLTGTGPLDTLGQAKVPVFVPRAPRPPTDANRWGVSPFGEYPRRWHGHGRCEKGSQLLRKVLPQPPEESSPIGKRSTERNRWEVPERDARVTGPVHTGADQCREAAPKWTRHQDRKRDGTRDPRPDARCRRRLSHRLETRIGTGQDQWTRPNWTADKKRDRWT
jgi:hypothetical protein